MKTSIVDQILKLNPNITIDDLYGRSDGRIEWICSHGTGHTVYSPNNNYTHGCCGITEGNKLIGCCSKIKIIGDQDVL